MLVAAAAWPADWTKRLLLVRGLSSKTNPDDLKSIFPDAEAIVVKQDMMLPECRLVKQEKKGNDG